MRLITWNINSVRLRVDLVRRLIEEANPDVLCLQETKTPDELFPRKMFEGLGYGHMLVHGMKGYNGVANLTRAMAVQLAPHGIRVNGVVPNKIGSPVGKDEFDPTRPVMNLRGRPGVPLDMARAVLFLVSDDSEFIAGNMLFVDGGVSAMMVGEKSA